MVLTGTLVNGAAIIAGALLGLCFRKIPERYKTTVMQALALCVIVLGADMALESQHFILVISSLVLGGWIGERLQLEERLNQAGAWLEKKTGAREGEPSVANAFVTATLVYVVGAMAVVGAMDSGLRLDHDILFTKSMLDGFTAIFFTSTLGIGVVFSAVPVVIYQGSIALLAGQIERVVPEVMLEQMITEVTAAGGIMILAIGLRIAGILHVRVANLLPALLLAALFVLGMDIFG
ncbi:hypothetical protein B0H94_106188 [Salsuginibacillus halophilus]|uniref:Membrane protein YdfK n=1 Tax=Salsuginibacillus halophilus TaxID=517424 RepID=A0A2P8HIE2_9BACI|nr:DUF554 domain-containing protein [Salsuginibacillus halophilus]PSL45930.1 hypothetical protein B0H94_106188 [Salsuginibacillus halophilus]